MMTSPPIQVEELEEDATGSLLPLKKTRTIYDEARRIPWEIVGEFPSSLRWGGGRKRNIGVFVCV